MGTPLIVLLVDIFTKLQEEGKDRFMILKLTVPLNTLWRLYEKLNMVDVMPIEMISDEKKTYYWNIAKKYHTEQELAIKASKSAYLLELITSTN